MRIALINPPQNGHYPQPPIGLASIAAVLEEKGYYVEIVDANALRLSESETVGAVLGIDIVGITAMTPFVNSAIRIAKGVKRDSPSSRVILGGPHATILAEDTLNHVPEIDLIVKGEGEETIVALLDALGNGTDLGRVNGIVYRSSGACRNTPGRTPIQDLDSLPRPAYHLLPLGKYRPHPPAGRRLPWMPMVTSRGCPYDCIYCSKPIFGGRFRALSPLKVVDEIEYLIKEFRIKEVSFYDDVFTLDRNRAMQIAKGIREKGFEIPWKCETRVNLVNEQLLKEMKSAGCYMIAYGIESGSQAILNNLRKGIKIHEIRNAIEITAAAGILNVGYFMVGSPGEREDTIRETLTFAKSLKLDFAQFAITIPFPGTDLYDLYIEHNDAGTDWSSFIYGNLEIARAPVFETSTLSRKDLHEWAKRMYREFYLRWPYICRTLIRTRSLGDIRTDIKGFSMLVEMMAR